LGIGPQDENLGIDIRQGMDEDTLRLPGHAERDRLRLPDCARLPAQVAEMLAPAVAGGGPRVTTACS
jgi:hypothetical protein